MWDPRGSVIWDTTASSFTLDDNQWGRRQHVRPCSDPSSHEVNRVSLLTDFGCSTLGESAVYLMLLSDSPLPLLFQVPSSDPASRDCRFEPLHFHEDDFKKGRSAFEYLY